MIHHSGPSPHALVLCALAVPHRHGPAHLAQAIQVGFPRPKLRCHGLQGGGPFRQQQVKSTKDLRLDGAGQLVADRWRRPRRLQRDQLKHCLRAVRNTRVDLHVGRSARTSASSSASRACKLRACCCQRIRWPARSAIWSSMLSVASAVLPFEDAVGGGEPCGCGAAADVSASAAAVSAVINSATKASAASVLCPASFFWAGTRGARRDWWYWVSMPAGRQSTPAHADPRCRTNCASEDWTAATSAS